MGFFSKVQKAPPPPPPKSVVGPKTTLKGDLESKNEVELHGRLEGTVKTEAILRLAPGSLAEGEFDCETLDWMGSGKGFLRVRGTAAFSETASFEGEVKASALRVSPGAKITGTLRKSSK